MIAEKTFEKYLTALNILFNVYSTHDKAKGSHYYEFIDRETHNTVLSVYSYKKAKCIAEGVRLGFSHERAAKKVV
jgi:hypothetical protein